MGEYNRPVPSISNSTKVFWEEARNHQLMAYKCQNCGTYYYPVITCMACSSPQMEWVKVSGLGKIYTFIVYDTAYNPQWEKYVPYNVSWIELDEGPMMMSNVIDCPNDKLYIGMPVEVTFKDASDEISLPLFKPRKADATPKIQ